MCASASASVMPAGPPPMIARSGSRMVPAGMVRASMNAFKIRISDAGRQARLKLGGPNRQSCRNCRRGVLSRAVPSAFVTGDCGRASRCATASGVLPFDDMRCPAASTERSRAQCCRVWADLDAGGCRDAALDARCEHVAFRSDALCRIGSRRECRTSICRRSAYLKDLNVADLAFDRIVPAVADQALRDKSSCCRRPVRYADASPGPDA